MLFVMRADDMIPRLRKPFPVHPRHAEQQQMEMRRSALLRLQFPNEGSVGIDAREMIFSPQVQVLFPLLELLRVFRWILPVVMFGILLKGNESSAALPGRRRA